MPGSRVGEEEMQDEHGESTSVRKHEMPKKIRMGRAILKGHKSQWPKLKQFEQHK